jgi:hypothetical protein
MHLDPPPIMMAGLVPLGLDASQLVSCASAAAGPPKPSSGGEGGKAGPGRPPTFDDMTQWCVGLKRLLWQRHGILITMPEAVIQVNKHFPIKSYKTKDGLDINMVLVKSTLRKRVP